ncbi:MAG: hypothetical protein ACR2IV_13530 [Bryobacteraceae bacterium]
MNNIFDNFFIGTFCDKCVSITEDYNSYNGNITNPVRNATLRSHSLTATDPQFLTSPRSDVSDVKLQTTSPGIGAGTSLLPVRLTRRL